MREQAATAAQRVADCALRLRDKVAEWDDYSDIVEEAEALQAWLVDVIDLASKAARQ